MLVGGAILVAFHNSFASANDGLKTASFYILKHILIKIA